MKMLAGWRRSAACRSSRRRRQPAGVDPRQPGHEKAAPVLLQGHADMVCVKTRA